MRSTIIMILNRVKSLSLSATNPKISSGSSNYQSQAGMRQARTTRIFLLTSILLLGYGIFQQILQLWNRVNIGIGLTDESFGILHAIDRGQNGQTSHTPLFADLTSILLRMVEYDIRSFRIVGYFFLAGMALLLSWRIIQFGKEFTSKSRIALICLTASFLMLLIPSSFRYLLVTPSYQWLVFLASIAIVCLLANMNRQSTQNKCSPILISVAFLVGVLELARLSSGFAAWLVVSIYLAKRAGLKRFLMFNTYVLTMNLCYIAVNFDAFFRNFTRLNQIRKIDPSGSMISAEILDVTKSGAIGYLLILLSMKIFNFCTFQSQSRKIHRLGFLTSLQTLLLVILIFDFPYKDPPHILAFTFMILIGILFGITKKKHDNFTCLLTLTPIISQFGSGISASYLIIPMMVFGFLYFVFSLPNSPSFISGQSDFSDRQWELSAFLIVVTLLTTQSIFSTTSYENGYGNKFLVKDPINGLMYTSEKMKNILQLRSQVENWDTVKGSRILDLSYWHPGVIFYIGGMQFPTATFDRYYRQTISQQVRNTLNQEAFRNTTQKIPIIVESRSISPRLECVELSEQITEMKILKALSENSFNPNLIEIAVYKSVPEDLTLYPRNISIMVPCTP